MATGGLAELVEDVAADIDRDSDGDGWHAIDVALADLYAMLASRAAEALDEIPDDERRLELTVELFESVDALRDATERSRTRT